MQESSLIMYYTDDGVTSIQLKSIDGTVWLTQAEIAELFQTTTQNITLHIKAIYEEGELTSQATCKEYLQVRMEGERQIERNLRHYNLELILAVGYRIKSPRGTQFRIWATTTLQEYLIKGFVMDDERLKSPDRVFNYFDELLERIRAIRASEKLFYQKIKDIYTQSMDYDSKSDQAQQFFKTVQNKMLYAVTGLTAAELVSKRYDPEQPNAGLTHWDGFQKGRGVQKKDVVTAKNYLLEPEIAELNRIVTMFLDAAEDTAKRRQSMYMKDWKARLDDFLHFNERPILNHAGNITHEHAEKMAHERYTVFDSKRREENKANAEREAMEDLKQLTVILEAAAKMPVEDAAKTSATWHKRLAKGPSSDSATLIREDRDNR